MKLLGLLVSKRVLLVLMAILLVGGSVLVLVVLPAVLPRPESVSTSANPASGSPDGPSDRRQIANANDVPVDVTFDGQTVDLKLGQELVVNLEGNPATGYMWEVREINQAILQKKGDATFEPKVERPGASGTVTLRFEPKAEGESPLRLVYRRPWEQDKPSSRSFSVAVRVSGAVPGAPTPFPVATPSGLQTGPSAAGSAVQTVGLPASYDWCDEGGCTSVKDQGDCGSCWAFATVGVLEANIRIQDGVEKDLSEQYLISCNTEGWSCDGGWWAHDYHKDKVPPGEQAAGAVSEANFPYSGTDSACRPPRPHEEKISSWSYVSAEDAVPSSAAIKQAIYDYGPVAVAMCVGGAFAAYRGGVFAIDESSSCWGGVNHGVILTGWDDSQGSNGIWYLRNSWGDGWGERGYMRIARGVSNVGYGASYVVYGGSTPAPVNDEFDQATVITSMPYTDREDTLGATVAADDPVFRCVTGAKSATVWYRFTPSGNGLLTVSTAGSGYDTVLGVWKGSRGGLISVGCNDNFGGAQASQVGVALDAGTTYHIEVAATTGTGGVLALKATFVSADLVPTDLGAPATAGAGRVIRVSWTVGNQGSGNALPSWSDKLYLSTDDELSLGDIALGSITRGVSLPSGGSYAATLSVTLPKVAAGSYYLILRTDDTNRVSESNESNNVRVASFAIQVPVPDLTLTRLTASSSGAVGKTVPVSWTVLNQGTDNAPPYWYDKLYLSADATWDAADTLITSATRSAPLGMAGSYSITRWVAVPRVAAGSYYLILRTDDTNRVSESNETNNVRVVPIAIQVPVPDLTLTRLTAPSSGAVGKTVPVSWTVLNQGTGDAPPYWYDKLYLSADATWDAADTLITSATRSAPLPAGSSYPATRWVAVPRVAAGSYYLILRTDDTNRVSESNETNNVRVVTITIQ
ncbi:MAG: hypothetical protein EPO21_16720 [Chloroflexota bacterium]|nr:MAG: hypothetical protein EPO21_16720 [Chloroflexota bacterium]